MDIVDFSIGIEDWVSVSSPLVFWAEVNEPNYTVTASGTYFEVNGSRINTVISGSGPNYSITSDPVSVSGNISLYLNVSNSNYDNYSEYYEFLYGYHVTHSSTDNVDWGAESEVVVKTSAANTAICPNIANYCTYFFTKEYGFSDLGSSITPQGWTDLGAYIKAQDKRFRAGHTYKVKVSGLKDFDGNVMEDIEIIFTIES